MLALDHRGSFKKYVKPEDPDGATDDEVTETKKIIINALEDQFSGVLIDPDWGLKAYKGGKKPYLLCLEKTGYVDTKGERVTELGYSAEQLKNWGASGTKLLIYFNPDAETCGVQLEVTKKALIDSHANGLPLFLEIVTYGNEEKGKGRAEWVLRSLQYFIDNGVAPDVWKLEYPGDAESCNKITGLVGETPWILLTRGESFDVFREQLKEAAAAGAVGFLAGRALWQEIKDYKTPAEKKSYMQEIVVPRFAEISAIVLKK